MEYLLQMWCGDAAGWATIARGSIGDVSQSYADHYRYAPDARFRTVLARRVPA